MANINRVVLVGNLTRDPELRHTPSGMAVCSLRLAVNTRRKDSSTGEWTEKPNYFDVTVWGNQGENCAQYLAKGRPVAIDGRLEWREWDAQDGTKRQAVEIIADTVQFLGGRVGVIGLFGRGRGGRSSDCGRRLLVRRVLHAAERAVARHAVGDLQHARDLVECLGGAREEEEVVDRLALVSDLVREPAAAPGLVAVSLSGCAVDCVADALDDLVGPLLGQLGVQQQHDFVLVQTRISLLMD